MIKEFQEMSFTLVKISAFELLHLRSTQEPVNWTRQMDIQLKRATIDEMPLTACRVGQEIIFLSHEKFWDLIFFPIPKSEISQIFEPKKSWTKNGEGGFRCLEKLNFFSFWKRQNTALTILKSFNSSPAKNEKFVETDNIKKIFLCLTNQHFPKFQNKKKIPSQL